MSYILLRLFLIPLEHRIILSTPSRYTLIIHLYFITVFIDEFNVTPKQLKLFLQILERVYKFRIVIFIWIFEVLGIVELFLIRDLVVVVVVRGMLDSILNHIPLMIFPRTSAIKETHNEYCAIHRFI